MRIYHCPSCFGMGKVKNWSVSSGFKKCAECGGLGSFVFGDDPELVAKTEEGLRIYQKHGWRGKPRRLTKP